MTEAQTSPTRLEEENVLKRLAGTLKGCLREVSSGYSRESTLFYLLNAEKTRFSDFDGLTEARQTRNIVEHPECGLVALDERLRRAILSFQVLLTRYPTRKIFRLCFRKKSRTSGMRSKELNESETKRFKKHVKRMGLPQVVQLLHKNRSQRIPILTGNCGQEISRGSRFHRSAGQSH
jgi:hypothetical protein